MDDRDLDSAALWAAVDSAAAAQASRRDHVPRPRNPEDNDHRGGEVVQPARPFKVPRLLSTPPPPSLLPLQTPLHSSPNLTLTPDAASASATRLVVVDTTPPTAHLFPAISVANFRKYQEAALSILDKSDYTSISGNPYIKKSGWRKISCFFNISFEIKDRSIEFDENRNVNRAEFLVRASMQGGRFSDGWGSCDRREKKFNKPNHDVPSTAETRAKNKACQDLVGLGNNRPV